MENRNGNAGKPGNGLTKIQTNGNEICHDDSSGSVKAQTIDELHSLQKKKSAPTTPSTGYQFGASFANLSEEDRQRQQLQSIRYLFWTLFQFPRYLIAFCHVKQICYLLNCDDP